MTANHRNLGLSRAVEDSSATRAMCSAQPGQAGRPLQCWKSKSKERCIVKRVEDAKGLTKRVKIKVHVQKRHYTEVQGVVSMQFSCALRHARLTSEPGVTGPVACCCGSCCSHQHPSASCCTCLTSNHTNCVVWRKAKMPLKRCRARNRGYQWTSSAPAAEQGPGKGERGTPEGKDVLLRKSLRASPLLPVPTHPILPRCSHMWSYGMSCCSNHWGRISSVSLGTPSNASTRYTAAAPAQGVHFYCTSSTNQ